MTTPSRSTAPGLTHPWPEPPAHGAGLTVAPGIRWLRMPLPFRLDHINLYLLEDEGGWTVVDAGIGLERTRELWQAVLEAGLDGRPLRRLLVTHFHPDHIGNAHWLTERSGIDLWCSQAEWLMAQLAWRSTAEDHARRMAHYRGHGLGEAAIAAMVGRENHYVRVVPSVPPRFHGLRDGDVLTIGERKWEVLAVYGHSPEQAIIYSREAGVLVAGDQILPKITTNVSVWPDEPRGNPLRLYLESMERFRDLPDDTLVLPAHGLPFQGLQARLRRLRAHHDERLGHALEAVASPRTAAEVMPELFTRDLDAQQLGFAMGETLAHLHYLEWQGRAVRDAGADGLCRFRRI